MERTKPFYSQKQIRNHISNGRIQITKKARETAQKDFGWGIDDVCKALSILPVKCWYKSDVRYDDPKIWVDYYRARNLKGENIYTHFYIDGEYLIIDSFKELSNEVS
jgi:hypothetical protein